MAYLFPEEKILRLERFKPVCKIIDTNEALFVTAFVIDYLIQKVGEDLMALKLILTLFENSLPLLELFLEPLDLPMLTDDFLFLLSEFLLFILALERVLLKDHSLMGYVFDHFLLLFLVFLTLGIQIFRPVNDRIFLTVKFLIVVPLFSLFLQKPYSLKGTLT
jgi:hypothetical protein